MATNLGRIGFVPKGNWVAGTYKFLDVVRYNGGTYACQVVSTANNPSNATDWMLLNSDGTQGIQGVQGVQGIQGIAGQVFSYVGTWAGKPASLTNSYTDRIFITDIGVGGSEWYWDGTRYRVVGGQVILRALSSSETLSATLTTATGATIDYGYSVPAGLLQAGDIVTVENTIAATSGSVTGIMTRNKFTTFDFSFGSSGSYTLPTAVDGFGVNCFRGSQISGFRVNSDTSVSGFTTGSNGFGATTAQVNRNVTVPSLTTNSHPIRLIISCTASTAVVVIDHLLITLKTCG